MTTAKRVLFSVAAVILLCTVASLSVLAAPQQGNAITSVAINKNKDAISIAATLSETYVRDNRGKSVYLFELMPEHDEDDLSSLTPIAEAKIGAAPSFNLPFDPSDTTRLLSRYVLASQNPDGSYMTLTDPYYISNPEVIAQNSYAFPTAASKKGLEVQLLSDAQMLGISYAVINVPIDSLLLGESSPDSVSYIFDSKTYYVSRAKLESLDHRIKVLSDSGTIVYLNIILGAPGASTPEKLQVLYYPDALAGSTARLCAVNMGNTDSVLYYAGLLNFLANRYTDPSGQYGFAGGWIIGYEVNSNRNYNFMGPAALADYTDVYVKTLRIADTMLRSVYSNGRVYVSVGNNFNAASSELNYAGDENLDYAARLFLERLCQTISVSGNIPWNLSINPYPSDPANTSYWNDAYTLNSFDTPYITMNNIKVICDFMGQENFLYASAKRRILVGSFGVSGEAVTSGEALQAAAFAYAYYTVASNDDLEALIWHRHVDSAEESGLLLGLWATVKGTSLVPAHTKSIYDVFKYIDTERFGSKEQSGEKTAFALKLIGAASWGDLIPGFDIDKVMTRSVHEAISYLTSDIDNKYKEAPLFDFSGGQLFDFYPADNVDYVELRSDSSVKNTSSVETEQSVRNNSVLYAKLKPDSPFEYMGVSKRFETPLDISRVGFITVHVKPEMPDSVSSASVMLRLLGRSSDNNKFVVYEGVTQVKPGEWSDVTFRLTDYAAKVTAVDTLKIWVKPYDNQVYEGNMALAVQSVSIFAKSSINVLSVVLWTILIIVIVFVLGFIALVARNQIRYRMRLRRQKQRALLKEQARRRQQIAYPPPAGRLPPPQAARKPGTAAAPVTRPRSDGGAAQTGQIKRAGQTPPSGSTGSEQQRRPRPRRKPPI